MKIFSVCFFLGRCWHGWYWSCMHEYKCIFCVTLCRSWVSFGNRNYNPYTDGRATWDDLSRTPDLTVINSVVLYTGSCSPYVFLLLMIIQKRYRYLTLVLPPAKCRLVKSVIYDGNVVLFCYRGSLAPGRYDATHIVWLMYVSEQLTTGTIWNIETTIFGLYETNHNYSNLGFSDSIRWHSISKQHSSVCPNFSSWLYVRVH